MFLAWRFLNDARLALSAALSPLRGRFVSTLRAEPNELRSLPLSLMTTA